MIYQRRDGFQIAEEATGTRLESGMEFLARPNKSDFWYTAGFNIVIDDDYELVGEEFIDCSRPPLNVLLFVDGVMKVVHQSRIALEDMIEQYDDAINDRDLIVARQFKADIKAAVHACHAEALAENASRSARLANEVMLCDNHRSLFSKCDPFVRTLMLEDAHAEALAIEKSRKLIARQARFIFHNSYEERLAAIEQAHAEALAIEAANKSD